MVYAARMDFPWSPNITESHLVHLSCIYEFCVESNGCRLIWLRVPLTDLWIAWEEDLLSAFIWIMFLCLPEAIVLLAQVSYYYYLICLPVYSGVLVFIHALYVAQLHVDRSNGWFCFMLEVAFRCPSSSMMWLRCTGSEWQGVPFDICRNVQPQEQR